jgi:8-oxo-dGTP pyrophosphatase MutT (NUDIX family)
MSKVSNGVEPNQVVRQAGVVAFRFLSGQREFCLITGRQSGRWGFPKGTIGETASIRETALSEAWQEAGLTGVLLGECLGEYAYRKRGRDFGVAVWLMHVETIRPSWKESNERSRIWVPVDRALKLIDRPKLAQLLVLAEARLSEISNSRLGATADWPRVATGFLPDSTTRS